MRRPIVATALLLALVAAACSGTRTEVAGPSADPGPQLVTLSYLRQQVEVQRAHDIGQVAVELSFGPGSWLISDTYPDDDWYRNGIVHVEARQARSHGRFDTATFAITYGGWLYDTGGGGFTTSNCRSASLPSSTSTGEYQTYTNAAGTSDITIDDTHTVTESSSSSTTLDESVQVSASLTLEAGTDIAKASATLESTFGIDKSDTEDKASSTEVAVEVTGVVPQGRDERVAYTVAPSSTTCDVSMVGLVDWADLRVGLVDSWCSHLDDGHGGAEPGWTTCGLIPEHSDTGSLDNRRILDRSEWVDGDVLKLTAIDDLLRIANGTTSRCVECAGLRLGARSKQALAVLSDPSARHVAWSGTQRSNAKRDAGYIFLDVSGLDADCLDVAFSERGLSVDALQSACRDTLATAPTLTGR